MKKVDRDFPRPHRRLDDRHPVIPRLARRILARADAFVRARLVDRDRPARHVHALAVDRPGGVGLAAEEFQALLEGGIVDMGGIWHRHKKGNFRS